MPRWTFALVQFFPLSLFITYAMWNGAPDDTRWGEAFQLAALAAAAQLAIVLPQKRPVSRLVLAANLYLLLGGVAIPTRQWWLLELYGSLREAAIFLIMLVVGGIATLATRAGYIAVPDASRGVVVRYSLALLAATAVALAMALLFRGDRYLAAAVPIIGLAVLQRVLAWRTARVALPPVTGQIQPQARPSRSRARPAPTTMSTNTVQ